MKKAFVVSTSHDHFARWLEDYTKSFTTLSFKTHSGRFSMLRASYNSINRVVAMKGTHIYIGPDGTERGGESYQYRDAITFALIPLAPDRTEVKAQCLQDSAIRMFERLLEEIQERWPDASSASLSPQPQESGSPLAEGLSDLSRKQDQILGSLASHDERVARLIAATARIEPGLNDDLLGLLSDVHSTVNLLLASSIHVEQSVKRLLRNNEELLSDEVSIAHKLELALPIIPLLLNYKAEVSLLSRVDLADALSHLEHRWHNIRTLLATKR